MPHFAIILAWALAADGLYTSGLEAETAEESRECFEQLVRLGEQRGVPLWTALGHGRLVLPHVRAGEWEAVRAMEPDLVAAVEWLPAQDAARVLDLLGTLARKDLELERALEYRERATDLIQDAGPVHRAFYGSRAAQILIDQGRPRAAWERVEPLLADAAVDASSGMVRERTQLVAARALIWLGDYDGAALLADEVRRDTQSFERWQEAQCMLVDVDVAQGRVLELAARVRDMRARDAQDETVRTDTLYADACLGILQGNWPHAERMFARAIENGADPLLEFEMRLERVNVLGRHDSLGAIAEARSLVALAEQIGTPIRLARAALVLGRRLRIEGDLEAAAEQYDRAITIADAAGLPFWGAQAAAGRARIAVRQGELDLARGLLLPAIQELRTRGETMFLPFALDTGARIAVLQGNAEEALAYLSEADFVHEYVVGAGMTPHALGRLRSRAFQRADLRQDVATLLIAEADERRRPQALEEGFTTAGHWKARALLAELAQRGREHSDEPGARIEVLQERLGGRVLIEYAPGLENLYAYVVDASGLDRVDLGAIDDALTRDIRGFVQGISSPPLSSPAEVAAVGGRLYERLVAPVLAGRPAPAGLVIVPSLPRSSLPISSLPFEALVVRASDEVRSFDDVVFVLDEHAVTYGPSSDVLAALARSVDPGGRRALVVGDPDFGSDRPGPGRGGEAWPRLRGTRREALDLMLGLLPLDDARGLARHRELCRSDERDVAYEGDTLDLYLGRRATTGVFDRDLGPYRWIHIAAHGRYDHEDPRRTELVLAGAEGLDLARVRELELDAELVVLSACETANGEGLAGEGVQSVAMGFLEAGARNVVASQWLVDDRAAEDLMHEFYRHLLGGESASTALTRAKRAMRRDRASRGVTPRRNQDSVRVSGAHPYRWAPFVLAGWGGS